MGGVRQQFTTAAEVRLARESVELLRAARPAALRTGRLPLPRHDRGRVSRSSSGGRRCSAGSACPSSGPIRASGRGCRHDDVLGASICREDGIADPAARDPRARPASRRTRRRGPRAHRRRSSSTPARSCSRPAPGRRRSAAKLGVELPVRPLVRQLVGRRACRRRARALADDDRSRVGRSTSGASATDGLRLAMTEPEPPLGRAARGRGDDLVEAWRARLAPPLSGRRGRRPFGARGRASTT